MKYYTTLHFVQRFCSPRLVWHTAGPAWRPNMPTSFASCVACKWCSIPVLRNFWWSWFTTVAGAMGRGWMLRMAEDLLERKKDLAAESWELDRADGLVSKWGIPHLDFMVVLMQKMRNQGGWEICDALGISWGMQECYHAILGYPSTWPLLIPWSEKCWYWNKDGDLSNLF